MSKELKFKVGDRVLVSVPDYISIRQSAKKYNGQIVQITKVKDDEDYPYLIEDYPLYWPDTYFTLAEEVEIKEITNSEVLNILEN